MMMEIPRLSGIFRAFACSVLICATLIGGPTSASAQTTDSFGEQIHEAQPNSGRSQSSDQVSKNQQQPSPQSVVCGLGHLGQCLKDIGHDQAGIWTSPLHIAPGDAIWLLPFAGATGVAIHYDAQAQQNLGIDKSRIDTSNTPPRSCRRGSWRSFMPRSAYPRLMSAIPDAVRWAEEIMREIDRPWPVAAGNE